MGPDRSTVASRATRLPVSLGLSFHLTKARVLRPSSATPTIRCGGSAPRTWVEAVRRTPSGPRRRTRAPSAPAVWLSLEAQDLDEAVREQPVVLEVRQEFEQRLAPR
jgi:hypothetical protein